MFGSWSVGFLSCFGPIFSHYPPFCMCWNGNAYHYMLEVYNLLFILTLQGIIIKRLHESQKQTLDFEKGLGLLLTIWRLLKLN